MIASRFARLYDKTNSYNQRKLAFFCFRWLLQFNS